MTSFSINHRFVIAAGLALAAMCASRAGAQGAATRRPPAPVPDSAPVLLRPRAVTPPPAATTRASLARPGVRQAPTPAPLVAMKRPSVAPDSVGAGQGVTKFVAGPAPVALSRAAAPASPTSMSAAAPPVAQASAPPSGATMRCRDGSWLTGAQDSTRCASNGGVMVMTPVAHPAPPRGH